ncbi:MAG: hypothetical protein OEU60_10050, partial [Gammaproteobacteria bacterium]|nr:hypothetical protein [Gammaproteobacteria bacterium]
EKFGVTGKRHTTVGNDALCKRCRDHAREFAREAAFCCSAKAVKQGAGIAWVRLTGLNIDRKGHVDDAQALVELPLVADDDEILGVWTADQRVTQLWSDASGLAGSDY